MQKLSAGDEKRFALVVREIERGGTLSVALLHATAGLKRGARGVSWRRLEAAFKDWKKVKAAVQEGSSVMPLELVMSDAPDHETFHRKRHTDF